MNGESTDGAVEGNEDRTRTCDWRKKIGESQWRGLLSPPAEGVAFFFFLPPVPSVHRWPEKSATGTKHKDQGQMMSCSRRESGKEGSPCHYYSAPSPSFSLIVRTIVLMLEREGENKGWRREAERERGTGVRKRGAV